MGSSIPSCSSYLLYNEPPQNLMAENDNIDFSHESAI